MGWFTKDPLDEFVELNNKLIAMNPNHEPFEYHDAMVEAKFESDAKNNPNYFLDGFFVRLTLGSMMASCLSSTEGAKYNGAIIIICRANIDHDANFQAIANKYISIAEKQTRGIRQQVGDAYFNTNWPSIFQKKNPSNYKKLKASGVLDSVTGLYFP